MMAQQWLDKIRITTNSNPTGTEYPLGVDFDHVYYGKENSGNNSINSWTLRDFFKKVQNFFGKPMFMAYSKENNSIGRNNIMEWYSVTGDGIDSSIKSIKEDQSNG